MGWKHVSGSAIAFFLLTGPATADIAAFNNLIRSGDYKAASAEAAATWPTLDKSRADIAVIAREFGFVALVAGDDAAARDYSSFAAALPAVDAAAQQERAGALILERAAEHHMMPTGANRKALVEALAARPAALGVDNVTRHALSILLTYDFAKGRWSDALSDTKLAADLADHGGRTNLLDLRGFQLENDIAAFLDRPENTTIPKRFRSLGDALIGDIDSVGSDAEAVPFGRVFWEADAWSISINAHMHNNDGSLLQPESQERSERVNRLLHLHPKSDVCKRSAVMAQKPAYPVSALYDHLVGTVILSVDVDATGASSNPRVLAAVPEKPFGDAVMQAVGGLRFKPDKSWNPALCKLEEKNNVVVFSFVISR